uniref:PUM-HD domain-containing protein n=1 Tax=Schistocephalus solidus TaxID=70667 RepID=A0A0X3PV35_SCHSO
MLATAKGKIEDLCMAHDTSRIVESLIQFGTEAQRWHVFGELKDRLRRLSMSNYARFVVRKMIVYGAKEHRLEFFKALQGYIGKLLRHKYASEVVELLYNDYATVSQRAALLREAYGHHIAPQQTMNNVQHLDEALELNPDKRQTIMASLNDLLVTAVSKGLVRLTIIQHLLLEYLTAVLKSPEFLQSHQEHQQRRQADQTEQQQPQASTALVPSAEYADGTDVAVKEEKEKQTVIPREDSLQTLLEAILEAQIVSMLHTREGVRAALAVLWLCPPKDRKTLVRSLKTFVASLAFDEHGHLFLVGLLDAVDDTKLVCKYVIKELLADLEDIVAHPHARKVLLYLLAPRDQRHFPAQLVENLLVGGDDSPFTRKPLGLRALEYRSPTVGILPALLRLATDRLVAIFVGDPKADLLAPLEDRSRLILLGEILSRSSAHELRLETVLAAFKRTGSMETDRIANCQTTLSTSDFEELQTLRLGALRSLVEQVLATPFHPVGITCPSKSKMSAEERREVQQQRRKRALAIAESESLKKRKVTVKAFTNPDEADEPRGSEALMDSSTATSANMPFLERPEGQLLIKRLLREEKASKSFDLGRLIITLVPAEILRAWTTCNRSCFTLVNLLELEDAEICGRLRKVLLPCIADLKSSPLAGAKILCKHLTSG